MEGKENKLRKLGILYITGGIILTIGSIGASIVEVMIIMVLIFEPEAIFHEGAVIYPTVTAVTKLILFQIGWLSGIILGCFLIQKGRELRKKIS